MEPKMLTTEPFEDFDEDSVAEPSTPPEPDDLDPATWLARDEGDVVGFVSVRGGKLKVGALTQGEMEMLRKRAEKPNPRNPRGEKLVDPAILNRWVIAHALSKGNGTVGTPNEVQPDQLKGKLTGELTEVARKILKLSGFVPDEEREDETPFTSPGA